MKKILLILILLSFLYGCFNNNFVNSDVEGQKQSKKIIEYLKNKDVKNFKSMLSETTKEIIDIDEQINNAMDFIQGDIIDYGVISVGSGDEFKGGNICWMDFSPLIEDVKTNLGETYLISFFGYLVNSSDNSKVGISILSIISSDGEECTIGEYIGR
jgi:hypothetical protein